jgi:hypothetical protein
MQPFPICLCPREYKKDARRIEPTWHAVDEHHDSPAAEDPRLQSLLEDLELVLVQISILPAARTDEDVDMITEGIEQRNMLPRLRTAIPAGPVTSGT